MRKATMRWSLLLLTLFTAACGPRSYSSNPVSASVVDSATKLPLAGVVVVALWQLESGHSRTDVLKILETETDSQGQFAFPDWGPISTRHLKGRLLCDDPQLMIFRDGYRPEVLRNSYDVSDCLSKNNPVRSSEWTGKVIALDRLDDSQFLERMDGFGVHIWMYLDVDSYRACSWKNAPRMLAALHKAAIRLTSALPNAQTKHLFTVDTIEHNAKCGDPKLVFGGLLP